MLAFRHTVPESTLNLRIFFSHNCFGELIFRSSLQRINFRLKISFQRQLRSARSVLRSNQRNLFNLLWRNKFEAQKVTLTLVKQVPAVKEWMAVNWSNPKLKIHDRRLRSFVAAKKTTTFSTLITPREINAVESQEDTRRASSREWDTPAESGSSGD